MTSRIACVIAALSLTCFSTAEAQSETANEVDGVSSDTVVQTSTAQEPIEPEPEPLAPEPVAPEPVVPEPVAPTPEPVAPERSSEIRLRFRSIRIYAGAALQMAPVDAPSSFETVCELPCNADVQPGSYHLNVLREDGNEYALPGSMDFNADARISLKYGASTASWVGGIIALTGVLGILISGGVAIAGAANDNSGQTTAGLVGLGVSSLAFGGGLVTFLLSERGLRAVVVDAD